MAQENPEVDPQIQRDVERRIDEKFQHWAEDAMSLMEMADIDKRNAVTHIAFTLTVNASQALIALGVDRARAMRLMGAAFDRVMSEAKREGIR